MGRRQRYRGRSTSWLRWGALALVGLVLAVWVAGNTYAAVVIANGGRDPGQGRDPASVGLAFRDVTYGHGLAAWYVAGAHDRPVIVVVHGYGGNRTGTLELGPPLHQLGYGLLFIELGYVDGRGHYRGGQREADEVAAATRWVAREVRRPVVVLGFSGGAFASLAAVARGAKVGAVIADSGFVSFRHVAAFRAHLPRVFSALMPLLYPPLSGGGHLVDVAVEIGDRPFPAPALVIHGTADRTVPPSGGADLARLTGGRLWLLAGVGHTKAFDHDRAVYVARLDEFIGAAVANPVGKTVGGR